ncbi:cytochrome b/b6 domain-containing protein [Aliiroseovarius sp. F20344]|uniref:cytochrome b n=1 Tax=Aliiroseovarius sp. F20344 TaxID=2926414 RepID=UPI001FF3D413|nr:cytochrome b/b6 domain-containing protein [Aliiroseovarius sp. F20344]MCK0142769.1 cytochrome b/b6 domain-containing protein [Aliiroseovarius sp. F20344]
MTAYARPHGFVTKGIHWLSAGLIGYGYLKGLEDVSQLADPALIRSEIVFALLLGGLFLLRWFWTHNFGGTTRLPQAAPKWEHLGSRAVHIGLYAAVFGIVLTGLAIALGYATPVLSGVFLTAMIGLHEAALAALPLLLLAHIAGALWHKFIRGDGVLESMTGRIRSR